MLVGEIMTRDVFTVTADTTVAEVAKLFVDKRISGAPVVDKKGEVIGIVSEADLLHRTEIHTERQHSWLTALFDSDVSLAREFVRQGARKAADIMSSDLTTVSEDATLAAAADLLDKNRVKRLVVQRGKKLVGIITRSDIVRTLAKSQQLDGAQMRASSDDDLRQLLCDRMKSEPWAKLQFVNTHVHDGIVELNGFVGTETQKKALRVLAENLPGVQAVRDRVKIYDYPLGSS